MKDVNKIILVGRLGADPVQRETKNGQSVVHFPLATSHRVAKDTGPEQIQEYGEETQWHRIVVWGRQGEACAQYLRKGRPVYVEGSVRSKSYLNREGHERIQFEVIAENVSFLGSPKPAEAPMANQEAEATA